MFTFRINMKWKSILGCLLLLSTLVACSSTPTMLKVAQQERSESSLSYEIISPPYDSGLEKIVHKMKKQAGVETIQHKKHTLVVITLGQRPSAGYKLVIETVQKKADKIVISYSEKKPQGMAASVISYPTLVVKLAKTDLPIQIHKSDQ